jgi:PAS domain-containing protein
LIFLGLLVGIAYQVVSRQAGLARSVRRRAEGLQQEAEEALRVSRAYFSNIVDISEDAIICLDGAQRITLFAQGAERIFGYRAAEVLGRPLEILLPQRFVGSHARHVEGFVASPMCFGP